MTYDSTQDTLAHIKKVQDNISQVIAQLADRAVDHDISKLDEPEKSIFDKYTPLLSQTTYGSDEYKQHLLGMSEALIHHYKKYKHHPEHYPEHGIYDMTLIDLMEMLCDWKAASERHDDGDMLRSLEINVKRFKIEPRLERILGRTTMEMGWDK